MSDVDKELYWAATRGDDAAVKEAVGKGADVNWANPDYVRAAAA